jgi:hypothetical protein
MSRPVSREPEPARRGPGNPNMKLQRAGFSLNPGGRRRPSQEERDWLREANLRMKKDHPDNAEWLINTRNDDDAPWEVRARIAIHLDNKIRSDPPRVIAAAHAHVDLNELTKDAGELDGLAAVYGAMIGAIEDPGPMMLDVTPSRSRALPAPPTVEELREAFEAEQAEAQPERRVRRPRRMKANGG